MSGVKRYYPDGRDWEMVHDQSGEYVLGADFDAEHALRLKAERQVRELREQLAINDPAGEEVLFQVLDAAVGIITRRAYPHALESEAWNAGLKVITNRRAGLLATQPNTCTKDGGQCGLGGYCEPCHNVEPKCTCPSGDGSLRWPCPVHPAEVKAAASFADGIEAAAKLIEHRMNEYVNEHGSYNHDTGYTEFPGNGDETVEEWAHLAESIRAITPPTQAPVVLPERINGQQHDDPIADAQQYDWNACPDELKRLNPTL